ncbi:GAP family protein [Halorhabdus rudnickae]|uniref:GAP family protein n=1 Tax=Halorhabdus rudnickae TaxID=1775544 RepID=UPI001082EABD|nr:GAP family protein [Halorhabdus rudnickae]
MGFRGIHRIGLAVVVLLAVLVGGATTMADAEAVEQTTTISNDTDSGEVHVVFFHLPTCPHCANVEAFLEEQRDDHKFSVEKYNARKHTDRMTDYLREYDVPRKYWGTVPVVFVDDAYAIGDRPAIKLLEKRFEATAEQDEVTTEPGPEADNATTEQGPEADNATAGPAGSDSPETITLVSLAGLAIGDAINPCALAVLVVLLTTILTRNPEQPVTVLKSGLAFSLAVGLTYAGLGLLLIFGLKSAANAATVEIGGLRRLFGLLAIGLGLLNVKDGVSHGAGGFVFEVPRSWRPTMQRYLTKPLWNRAAVLGGLLAGIAVSLFLLPCTGGPYIVAGGILAEMAWSQSIPLLVAYNFVFVLPMIVITVAVAGGYTKAEAVGAWREKHIETLHFVAGGLLVGLGILLVAGLL